MEKSVRKSTRARSMSEHYISVECRLRSPKSRRRSKKIMTEIKQEPEEEGPILNSLDPFPSFKLESSTKNQLQEKLVITPSKTSKNILNVKVKDEPIENPSGSTEKLGTDLSSINDDIEFIQQSIKDKLKAPENLKSKKRVKKNLYSDGHKCSSCGRTYKYRKGMLQHQRLECNLEPQFPCPYCPLKFRYRHQIQKHVLEQHNQAFERWYKHFYLASINPNPRFIKKEQQGNLN